MDDAAADELLEQVTGSWGAAGVLGTLLDLVRQVWRTDLARFDPALGDDAMSLGMQASRNLCNLAVQRLRDVPGVVARDRRTLEVMFEGRVLHVGKAPSDALGWRIDQIDWAASDVREDAATANTSAYQSPAGTLFEDHPDLAGRYSDPHRLRQLHLTWQGLPDGSTRTWIGFPRLGLHPWYAVTTLDEPDSGQGTGAPAVGSGHDVPLPAFDDLSEPDVRITRRTDPVRRSDGVRRSSDGVRPGDGVRRGGDRPGPIEQAE